jgi:hypothetical protein
MSSNEKQISRQTQRPVNTNDTTLRLKTLLLHKETERHRKPIHRNGSNGSHKTHNGSTIHAPAQLQRRRMDMHRSNNSQRSHQTRRNRVPIRHNNRRNTAVQKTQITLLFFFLALHLIVCAKDFRIGKLFMQSSNRTK